MNCITMVSKNEELITYAGTPKKEQTMMMVYMLTYSQTNVCSCLSASTSSRERTQGTLIYDKDKNFVKEIEWKPNRALVFCKIPNTTWHNFVASSKSPRMSYNIFYQTLAEHTDEWGNTWHTHNEPYTHVKQNYTPPIVKKHKW